MMCGWFSLNVSCIVLHDIARFKRSLLELRSVNDNTAIFNSTGNRRRPQLGFGFSAPAIVDDEALLVVQQERRQSLEMWWTKIILTKEDGPQNNEER